MQITGTIHFSAVSISSRFFSRSRCRTFSILGEFRPLLYAFLRNSGSSSFLISFCCCLVRFCNSPLCCTYGSLVVVSQKGRVGGGGGGIETSCQLLVDFESPWLRRIATGRRCAGLPRRYIQEPFSFSSSDRGRACAFP